MMKFDIKANRRYRKISKAKVRKEKTEVLAGQAYSKGRGGKRVRPIVSCM